MIFSKPRDVGVCLSRNVGLSNVLNLSSEFGGWLGIYRGGFWG